MPYGVIKVDNITFTNGGADQATTVSGIYRAITSGVTVTGTISGVTIQGATVSGTTVTGTTANFVSGVFTTQLSGATITGTTANFTSGNFTALSGASTTVTSGIFAVGSAAAPSISFTSDPNTGIYSPAADTLAFVEGGVEVLRIDSSGRVGIGTTSPGSTLHLLGAPAELRVESSSSSDGFIRFVNTSGSMSVGMSGAASNTLLFADRINGHVAYQYFGGASGLHAWNTNNTERARIDSSGNVGIGTSAPSSKLEISSSSGSGSSYSAIKLNNTSLGGARIDFGNNSVGNLGSLGLITEDLGSGVFNDGVLVFSTSEDGTSNERMRISSRGLVGIGTATPLTKLEVRSGVITAGSVTATNGPEILKGYYGNDGALTVIGSEYSSGGPVIGCGVKPSTSATDAFLSSTSIPLTRGAYTIAGNIHKWYIGASQTVAENSSVSTSEAMRIDSSGRVGIGTTSPAALLDVKVASDAKLLVQDGNTTGNVKFNAVNNAVSTNVNLEISASNTQFFNGGTERARIDSSGRVGIGTTSPTRRLDIEAATANIGITGTNNSYIDYAIGASNIGIIGDANWTFGGSSSNLGIRATNNLVFGIGANERARIDSSGRVGIGASVVSELLHIKAGSSAGLDPTVLIANGAPATSETGSIDFGFNTQAADPDVLGRISTTITNRTSGAQASTLSFGVASSGSLATRMTLTGTGLGIGTTSPAYALDVRTTGTSISSSFTSDLSEQYIALKDSGTTLGHVRLGSTSGSMLFFAGNGERLRIDSSGRLLVGTSTYDGNARAVIQGNTSSNTTGALIIRYNGTRPASAGESIGSIRFESTSQTSSNYHYASISCDTDGPSASDTDIPGRLVFSTTADGAASPTERMRIGNDGHISNKGSSSVNIGTNGWELFPGGNAWFTCTDGFGIVSVNRKGTDGNAVDFYKAGTAVGSISVTTSATAYNTSSDYRLKENVAVVTDGITRLLQLKPSRFNFIANPDQTVDGFIAHEAQAVVPECVTGEKDAVDGDGNPVYQGIDQSKLVPLLTAALQEAITKIETLEARLTAAEIA